MNRKEVILEEFKKFALDNKLIEGTVLDVGCGNDDYKKPMEELGLSWLGLDIIDGPSIAVKGKMEDIPLHDSTVTGIMCNHVFEHTIDPLTTLKEFKRVIKSRGFVFTATPVPTDLQIFMMDKTHTFVLNEMQLTSLLQRSGFMVLRAYKIKDDDGGENIITISISM